MKLSSRKVASTSEQRRNAMQTDRARSPALRETFPKIEMIRIDLNFKDGSPHTPSPQQHTLYPAARAFFRFSCPCVDCDGDFDLTPLVTTLVNDSTRAKRNGERGSAGALRCEGVRFRDKENSRPCPMELKFQLSTTQPA